MTNATTLQQPCARPTGFDRLALAVGLALVSWARRSSNRVAPTHEELTIRRAAELEAHHLRAQHSAARSHYSTVR